MAWAKGMIEVNGINLMSKYGIIASKVTDVLTPKLRERKITIPRQNGRYDYGATHREERSFIVDCNISKNLSRTQLRELAYDLSGKVKIRTWEEPDKYYIGQLYNPESLNKIGFGYYQFTLEFTCNPFAYGESKEIPIKTGINKPDYNGTAETPCLIVLRNEGTETITNIQIKAIFKKR